MYFFVVSRVLWAALQWQAWGFVNINNFGSLEKLILPAVRIYATSSAEETRTRYHGWQTDGIWADAIMVGTWMPCRGLGVCYHG